MKKRVSEAAPTQVYLGAAEQKRLELLAKQLGSSKSEALRRGLLALERELSDPLAHPALRLIGIAPRESEQATPMDAARDHDLALVDDEEVSWGSPKARGTKRHGR